MSHAATNWAIQQRGLKPATKIVLWHLCDRHHSDNGCFPSQETLANDCEMSRSAVNTHLDLLENAGLIAREQRRQKGSQRQERTRYFFAFEPTFARVSAEKPSPETGHGSGDEAVSGKSAEPCPENDESRVRNPDSNPVREPLIEPGNERERARAVSEGMEVARAEGGDDARLRRARLSAFDRWYRTWPAKDSSHDTARDAWLDLDDAQRAACIERTPDYIDWVGGPKKITTWAAVYLREKRWEMLPPKANPTAPPELAKPFGKAGMAYRLWLMKQPEKPHQAPPPMVQQILAEGGERAIDEIIRRKASFSWPRLADLDKKIVERDPVRVPAEIAALGADFMPVELDSELGAAWKRAFRARRLPWLPVEPKYAYLPPVDMATDDLDRAVSAAIEDFRRRVEGEQHAAAE